MVSLNSLNLSVLLSFYVNIYCHSHHFNMQFSMLPWDWIEFIKVNFLWLDALSVTNTYLFWVIFPHGLIFFHGKLQICSYDDDTCFTTVMQSWCKETVTHTYTHTLILVSDYWVHLQTYKVLVRLEL